jgi:hypothetical protein
MSGEYNNLGYSLKEFIEYTESNLDGFSEDILTEIEVGLRFIKMAKVYVRRIDYLLAGDDGEESFKCRLAEDLVEVLRDNPSA